MKKLLLEYLQKKTQFEKKGEPNENDELFEEILFIEDNILKKFGLPSSKKYSKILWEFDNKDDIETIISSLNKAAKEYLISPPKLELEILLEAIREKSNPYDILPEIGVVTHDYTLFIYNHILLTQKKDVGIIWNEYKKVHMDDLLSKVYILGTKNNPQSDILYKEIKKYNLKFLNDYLKFVHQNITSSADNYSPNYFLITDFIINEIVFDNETSPSIFCTKSEDDNKIKFTMCCSFNELGQLLLSNGELGKEIQNKIAQILKQPFVDKPIVIELKEVISKPLLINDLLLEVYKPQHKDKNGKWVEDNDNLLVISDIFQRIKAEVLKKEPFKEKLTDCLNTISNAYKYYLNLKNIGLSEKECRKRAGLLDELLFFQAYLLHKIDTPPKKIDENELKDYVFEKIQFDLDKDHLQDILNGFWGKWNASTFETIGDGDFKNSVYRYLEGLNRKDFIPQIKVDKIVDLILGYLKSLGQWG